MVFELEIAYSLDSDRERTSGIVAAVETSEALLQPEEQIAKTPSVDQVKGWVELMTEWDRLCAELTQAQAARQGSETLPGASDVALIEAETVALARMQALKDRIDTFLGDAAKQRQPVKGALVMGTLLTSSGSRSADDASRRAGKDPFKRES